MKIKCQNCGKRYDYEERMGICPKCGRYERQDPENVENLNEEGSLAETVKSEIPRSEHFPKEQPVKEIFQQEEETPKKKTVSLGFFVWLLACVGLIFGIIVIPGYYQENTTKLERELYQEQKVTNIQRKEHKIGESFEIPEKVLQIEAAAVYINEKIDVPEGWKYVQIPYKNKEKEEYSFSYVDIYLWTGDHFYTPVYVSDMVENSEAGKKIEEELEAENIETDFWDEKGKMLFLVPEQVHQGKMYIGVTEETKSYKSITIDKPVIVHLVNLEF